MNESGKRSGWKRFIGFFQKIFFTQGKFTLVTLLSAEEVRHRLSSNMQPRRWHSGMTGSSKEFFGELRDDGFWISTPPIGRNITPDFKGSIHSAGHGVEINMEVIPHPVGVLFQIMGLVMVLTMVLCLLYGLVLILFRQIHWDQMTAALAFCGVMLFFVMVILLINGFIRLHIADTKAKLAKLMDARI